MRHAGPRALFALMAEQHGVASRAQARAAGVTRAVEERLIAEGALVRAFPGVVAAGGVTMTFSAQAMAATLRPGVMGVSHGAAARLHRLAGFEHHPHIEVIGARGSHIRVDAPIFARYSRRPIDQHIGLVGAIRVTSIPLTLALATPEITSEQAADTLTQRAPPAACPRQRSGPSPSSGTERAGPGRSGCSSCSIASVARTTCRREAQRCSVTGPII